LERPSRWARGGEYTSAVEGQRGLVQALTQSAEKSGGGVINTGQGSPVTGREEGRTALRILADSRLWVVSHETHLPAEKAQARAYSRISDPDANARRSPDPEAPPRQGPQATHGLMRPAPGGRPKSGRSRLSRSADFDRVFRSGRSHAGREFVLYVFPRAQEGPPRLGLSVSRKVGGAVERNRVKRLVREAFARESGVLPPGVDAVVVARHDARALAEREGLEGVRSALAALIVRAVGPSDGARVADPGRSAQESAATA
jgi:ribonuclease P protein component